MIVFIRNIAILFVFALGFAPVVLADGKALKIELGGVVEVGYISTSGFDNESASTVELSLAEIAFDSRLNAWVEGHLQFLYEEGATALELDEGLLIFSTEKLSQFSLALGQMYLPFGQFESFMISDPLTLAIGESRDTAVVITLGDAALSGSIFFYKGDLSETVDFAAGNNVMDQFGANLSLNVEQGSFKLNGGFSYSNSLADSDGLTETLIANGVESLSKHVPGFTAYANLTLGDLNVIVEQVQAMDFFLEGEFAFVGDGADPTAAGAKPTASMLELAYTMMFSGRPLTVAVGRQATTEAFSIGLPEKRSLFSLSYEMFQQTSLKFELATDSKYAGAAGSQEQASAVTVLLSTEF